MQGTGAKVAGITRADVYPSSYDQAGHSPPRRGPSASTKWMAVRRLLVAGALIWTVLRQRSGDGGAASSPVATRPEMVQGEPRAITPRGDLSSDEQSTIELFRNVSSSVVHVTSVD